MPETESNKKSDSPSIGRYSDIKAAEHFKKAKNNPPVGEMSVATMRAEILNKLGMKGHPDVQFSKDTLNSLHAYFTGEFAVLPAKLHAEESMNVPEMRQKILRVVLDDLDGEEYPRVNWNVKADDHDPASFYKYEIREIIKKFRESKDRRNHPTE